MICPDLRRLNSLSFIRLLLGLILEISEDIFPEVYSNPFEVSPAGTFWRIHFINAPRLCGQVVRLPINAQENDNATVSKSPALVNTKLVCEKCLNFVLKCAHLYQFASFCRAEFGLREGDKSSSLKNQKGNFPQTVRSRIRLNLWHACH